MIEQRRTSYNSIGSEEYTRHRKHGAREHGIMRPGHKCPNCGFEDIFIYIEDALCAKCDHLTDVYETHKQYEKYCRKE